MDPSPPQSAWVAGADGARAGWIAVLYQPATGALKARLVPHFRDLLALPERPAVLAVDLPIGLPARAERGGRACDRAARALLGAPRGSSVFSPPSREALKATTHAAASARNRASGPDAPGLSIQAFGLFPKLREADAALRPALQDPGAAPRVVEAHPEVAFALLRHEAEGGPLKGLASPKKRLAGRRERLALLAGAGFSGASALVAAPRRPRAVAPDDVVDAAACAWTAARVLAGTALRLPLGEPPRDARGLRMEIWA